MKCYRPASSSQNARAPLTRRNGAFYYSLTRKQSGQDYFNKVALKLTEQLPLKRSKLFRLIKDKVAQTCKISMTPVWLMLLLLLDFWLTSGSMKMDRIVPLCACMHQTCRQSGRLNWCLNRNSTTRGLSGGYWLLPINLTKVQTYYSSEQQVQFDYQIEVHEIHTAKPRSGTIGDMVRCPKSVMFLHPKSHLVCLVVQFVISKSTIPLSQLRFLSLSSLHLHLHRLALNKKASLTDHCLPPRDTKQLYKK